MLLGASSSPELLNNITWVTQLQAVTTEQSQGPRQTWDKTEGPYIEVGCVRQYHQCFDIAFNEKCLLISVWEYPISNKQLCIYGSVHRCNPRLSRPDKQQCSAWRNIHYWPLLYPSWSLGKCLTISERGSWQLLNGQPTNKQTKQLTNTKEWTTKRPTLQPPN